VGDVIAGTAFGALLALLPLAIAISFTSAVVVSPVTLLFGIILGSLAFAALGVLMAAPATNGPSQVMMLSNLVRLPLIFVSGIFVPLSQMPSWGQWLSPLSPLSYCSDLIRVGFGEQHHWSAITDVTALIAFIVCFLVLAVHLHRKTQAKTH
jgi:ABC-2 type transport system permease protein